MSGRVGNQNQPAVANAHQPQRRVQVPSVQAARGAPAASSIGAAPRASVGRRRNPGPNNFSCLACIGIFFRALFRCLFPWCLPGRDAHEQPQVVQNPPGQGPPPVDELPPAPPVQNEAEKRNVVQEREALVAQEMARDGLTQDQRRVQLFLEQFPEPKGDQEESCEDFRKQFEEQVPFAIQQAAKNHVIRRFPQDIKDCLGEAGRNIKDDQKGAVRKVNLPQAAEAALHLIETRPNVVATVRTFLEEHIGIYKEDEE